MSREFWSYRAAFCLCTNYVISGAWTSRLLFLLWMLSARILEGAIRWPPVSSSCVCAYSQQQTPLTPRRVAAGDGELPSSCGGTALRLQEALLRAGKDGLKTV